MKMNVTIDLDWMGEDGTIDDAVKEELVHQIRNSILSQVKTDIEKKAQSAIDEAVNSTIEGVKDAINSKAMALFEEWLDKEIKITDEWGEVKKQASIHEVIKSRFSKMLEAKVDSKSGRILNSGDSQYNAIRLVDYLTGTMIHKHVKDQIGDFSRDIDRKIDEAVNRDLKEKIATKFAKLVVETKL